MYKAQQATCRAPRSESSSTSTCGWDVPIMCSQLSTHLVTIVLLRNRVVTSLVL